MVTQTVPTSQTSAYERGRAGVLPAPVEIAQPAWAPLMRTLLSKFSLACIALGVGFSFIALPVLFGVGAEISLAIFAFGLAAIAVHWALGNDHKAHLLQERLQDEHSYRTFIYSAIEGVFRTTRDGGYLFVNPALARIYGYETPEQMKSELVDIADQLYVDPTRREAFASALRENGFVANFVSQIRRRDGTLIWITENSWPVLDSDGQFLFYEGTVEDITPRREAEEATKRALEETREAVRAKAAFLSAMSHELKTPLNAVIGFSEMILAGIFGPLKPDKYHEYISDIHDNGKKLLGLINDILDLTRVEGKLIALDETMLSVPHMVDEAVQIVAPSRMGTPIAVAVEPGLPLLRADSKRVRQVLVHLLSNAVKFTSGENAIAIKAGRTPMGGIAISVMDTGIGMESERIAQALEPFRQLDGSLARKFEGSGLGLPLVNAFIKLHGGQLSIQSAIGEGTTVTATFPPDRAVLQEAAA